LNNIINEIKPGSGKSILEIKWPNDILLNNKKIAGILIEKTSSRKYYIIGIGINVNSRAFSTDTSGLATSLQSETGSFFEINDLLLKIIFQLSETYKLAVNNNLNYLFNLWKNEVKSIGKTVIYSDKFGQILSGKILDIVQSGTIIIEENGAIRSYNSEEIKIAEIL
jgi:BirA family biotin operon repressor/biotin-[acetyl-CoA-carboxylase] ligase